MTNEENATEAKTPSHAERLTLAREARAARERKDAELAELAEIEREELIARFERETKGKHGKAFAVVDLTETQDGFVVVTLGEDVVWKTYQKSKLDEMALDAFIVSNLAHPSKDAYHKIIAERPAYADRVGNALAALYGFRLEALQGKP